MEKSPRLKARDNFKSSFPNGYQDIGSKEIYKLEQLIINELSDHINEDDYSRHVMTLAPLRKGDIAYNEGHISQCYFMVDCMTHPISKTKTKPFSQWKRREAISFNRDGFIGFAGWASLKNEAPFVNAFNRWVDWMREQIKT
jgi:hypothetical protein